jgi:anti-sigma B factor antagonist
MKLSIANSAGEEICVALAGRVTQRELNPLQDPLIELLGPGGYGKIVRLDLSEADYVDSSGIGWLLSCHKRMRQAGGRLLIERPHPVVQNVFRVLKLEKVLELSDAAQAAGPAGGAA